MACACSKGRAARTGLAAGAAYVYDVTTPDGTLTTYGTPLEAKRVVRQHGGGTIVRRQVTTAASA